jgi:ADP-heptose:LPS heptosyltransferase
MKASRKPQRILIIKTHAIGDLLMATPAIRDIRAAHPSAHITLMVGSWSAAAVRHNPHINELLEVNDAVFLGRRNWRAIFSLLFKIRRGRFSKAFVFHPLPVVHLFTRLAGIPVRYGLMNEHGSRHLTSGVREDLGAQTYYPVNFQSVAALDGVAIGPMSLEAFTSPQDERDVQAVLADAGVGPGEDIVLVAPGGGRNSKEDVAARRWPAAKFAALLRDTTARHPSLKVVLTGSHLDSVDTAAVAAAVPGAVDLTARTTLPQLFALADRARAVVCNDSSLLHIAVARGTPAVVPFGPTGAAQRVPAEMLRFVEQSGLPCSPCYVGGRFPGCGIGFACMKEMSVEAIQIRLEAALAASH